MTLKEIETRVRTIAGGDHKDPEFDDATTRRDGLQRHVATLTEHLAARRAALVELELTGETALLAGKTFDDRQLATVESEIAGLHTRLQMHTRALTEAARRVTDLQDRRAAHVDAAITPLAVDLLARLERTMEEAAAIEAVLTLVHDTANAQCPPASPLRQGYCVFAPELTVAWWRAKVEASGLRSSKRERVA